MDARQPQFSFPPDPMDALTGDLEFVAREVRKHGSDRPVTNKELQLLFREAMGRNVDEREVKDIIRTLRREHGLPILARRQFPSGYYWCQSRQEMDDFIKTYLNQARDEFATVRKMVRVNYPELCGQMTLEVTD